MLPLRFLRRVLSTGTCNHGLYISASSKLLKPTTSLAVLKCSYASTHYVETPFPSLEYPSITIHDYVFQKIDNWPDKIAVECGVSGRKYTYSQLQILSKKFAIGLINSGLKPGQLITLVLPNIPEYLIALLGGLQAGLIVSPANPIYGADEIHHQVVNSESSCIITIPQKMNDVTAALSKIGNNKLHPTIVIHNPSDSLPEGTRSFMEVLKMDHSDDAVLKGIEPNLDDTALLLYSSGTTGLPKGVMLSHRQVVSNCVQMTIPHIRLAYDTTNNHQDVMISILPLFHIYGMTVGSFTNLHEGCKLITLPNFEPQSFLKVLKETTVAYLVPPLINYLANHPSVTPSVLENLRFICNGAAPISIVDAEKLLSKKHMLLTSGYGMTESSPVITACRNTCIDIATVGWPLSNSQMKIANIDTGETLDPSQNGEICVRGPQIMKGYFKNEEATAATIKNGWLHTGDVGYFGKEGSLYIVDRLKELIKVKGFQVAPLELEETLKQHPGVSEAAVVGKPDPRYGEVPVAFVVVTPGQNPTEEELKKYIASKVAEYKHINSVVFTPSIPKSTTGKILRKELRATFK